MSFVSFIFSLALLLPIVHQGCRVPLFATVPNGQTVLFFGLRAGPEVDHEVNRLPKVSTVLGGDRHRDFVAFVPASRLMLSAQYAPSGASPRLLSQHFDDLTSSTSPF